MQTSRKKLLIKLNEIKKTSLDFIVANQDILYWMWIRAGYPTKSVNIRTIGSFANNNKKNLNSRTKRGISPSGLDYAVLKFVLEYATPINWPQGLWAQFDFAKDPYTGNYSIWRRYTNLLVDIHPSSGSFTNSTASVNDKGPSQEDEKSFVQNNSPPPIGDLSKNHHESIASKSHKSSGLLIWALICFVIIFVGIYFITDFTKIPVTTKNPSIASDSCIGNCVIGQNATDGYYNSQKIKINRIFYLKHPYYDSNWPSIDNWHNWDWILIDISLTNNDSKNLTLYGTGTLTDAKNTKNYCFPGGYGGSGIELTDFLVYSEIKPGETASGNISCALNSEGERPYKFEYDFDNWYSPRPHDKGKNAVFIIDNFIPLEYDSIKSSLKGDKPF